MSFTPPGAKSPILDLQLPSTIIDVPALPNGSQVQQLLRQVLVGRCGPYMSLIGTLSGTAISGLTAKMTTLIPASIPGGVQIFIEATLSNLNNPADDTNELGFLHATGNFICAAVPPVAIKDVEALTAVNFGNPWPDKAPIYLHLFAISKSSGGGDLTEFKYQIDGLRMTSLLLFEGIPIP